MAANLYARSIFGEDALANLSIERSTNQPDLTVTGHIRIRAKSQVGVNGILVLKPICLSLYNKMPSVIHCNV